MFQKIAIGLTVVLGLAASRSHVDAQDVQHRLTWFVLTPTPQGPLALQSSEAQPFPNERACDAFGERMTPRMQDWIRGALRAEWDHEVSVAFKCDVAGMPS